MSSHGTRTLRISKHTALIHRYGEPAGEGVRHAEYLKRLDWETKLNAREAAHQEEVSQLQRQLASLEQDCTLGVHIRLQQICSQAGIETENGNWVQMADMLEHGILQLRANYVCFRFCMHVFIVPPPFAGGKY